MKQTWIFSTLMLVLLGVTGCEQQSDSSQQAMEQSSPTAVDAVVAEPSIEKESGAMTDSEKLALAQEMLDAWTDLDWERVYELFGEDGALTNMMIGSIVGEAAIRERLQTFETGLTRMDFVVLRLGVLDGEVIVERLDSFDFNGKTGIVPVAGVMTIEDGQVKEWREYYDRNWLLSEMGVIDAEPAHPISPTEPIVATDNMSDADKLAVARAMLNAYETQDWDKAASLIADDGVVHYVEKEPMHGPEAMRAHVERVGPALTNVRFENRHMGVIDGVVMMERVDNFDYKGRAVSIPVFGTMEISEGKIKVWREYYDHNQMSRGMGLIE